MGEAGPEAAPCGADAFELSVVCNRPPCPLGRDERQQCHLLTRGAAAAPSLPLKSPRRTPISTGPGARRPSLPWRSPRRTRGTSKRPTRGSGNSPAVPPSWCRCRILIGTARDRQVAAPIPGPIELAIAAMPLLLRLGASGRAAPWGYRPASSRSESATCSAVSSETTSRPRAFATASGSPGAPRLRT